MGNAIRNYLNVNNKYTYLEYSVYLFVLFLPLSWGVDVALMYLTFFLWLMVGDWQEKKFRLKSQKTSFYLLTGLFLIFLVALLYSDYFKTALGRVERTIPLVIFPLIFFSIPKDTLNMKKIFYALGIGLLIAMTVSWAYIITDILSKKEPLEQAKYFFQWIYTDSNLLKPLDFHPSYFVVLLVLFLTVFINKDYFKEIRKKKYSYIFTLLLLLVFLVETNSRVGFICFLLILLISSFIITNKRTKFLYIGILLLLVLIATQFEYLHNKMSKLFDANGNITFERYYRWQEILKVFAENGKWLFGVGNGDVYEIYIEAYSRGSFSLALKNKYNAHCQYLELLIGTGFLGLLWYMLVLANFVLRTKLKGLAMAFFILIFIFSFSESFLVRNKGVLFFSFFYCLFIIKTKNQHNGEEK